MKKHGVKYWDHHIELRPLLKKDIPAYCKYWCDYLPAFMESMGIDLKKLPDRKTLKKTLSERASPIVDPKLLDSFTLSILYNGKPIGAHSIGKLKFGKSGVFHAHIFDKRFRRVGLGSYTYPRASRIFFEMFELKKILFLTPTVNPGPNKLKQSLGLKIKGEVAYKHPILRDGIRAFKYELTRRQLEKIIAKQDKTRS